MNDRTLSQSKGSLHGQILTIPFIKTIDNVPEHLSKYGYHDAILKESVVLTDFAPMLMSDFSDRKNHCVLVALTGLFAYHRQRGCDHFPNRDRTLFLRLERLAKMRGIFIPPHSFLSRRHNPLYDRLAS